MEKVLSEFIEAEFQKFPYEKEGLPFVMLRADGILQRKIAFEFLSEKRAVAEAVEF